MQTKKTNHESPVRAAYVSDGHRPSKSARTKKSPERAQYISYRINKLTNKQPKLDFFPIKKCLNIKMK